MLNHCQEEISSHKCKFKLVPFLKSFGRLAWCGQSAKWWVVPVQRVLFCGCIIAEECGGSQEWPPRLLPYRLAFSSYMTIDLDDSATFVYFSFRGTIGLSSIPRKFLGFWKYHHLYYFSGASGNRSMTYFPLATLMIGTPGTRLILLFRSRSLVATI